MADDVHFSRFLIRGGWGEFQQVVWMMMMTVADEVHFLRFFIIGGRGEFHQVVWTLDHWSAAIWSLPTNIDASKQCGFKALLQYGSSLLQSS